jgi:hypothetical protein
VRLQFSGELWYWRGPSPFYFITVPDEQCGEIEGLSRLVSYGWGMIPVTVTIGRSTWQTSLWPKDGRYIVPIKALVRKREHLDDGSTATVDMTVG